MHTVEVDQSGRIDQTDRPTVLAFSGGVQHTVIISAKAKRECTQALRRQRAGKSPIDQYVLLFATLLYFLLKGRIPQLGLVVIDTEYPGHEASIKQHVLNLFRRAGVEIDPDRLRFEQVGKKSPAHALAHHVFKKRGESACRLTAAEVLGELGK